MLTTIINVHFVTERDKIGSWKKLKVKKESVTYHQKYIPLYIVYCKKRIIMTDQSYTWYLGNYLKISNTRKFLYSSFLLFLGWWIFSYYPNIWASANRQFLSIPHIASQRTINHFTRLFCIFKVLLIFCEVFFNIQQNKCNPLKFPYFI